MSNIEACLVLLMPLLMAPFLLGIYFALNLMSHSDTWRPLHDLQYLVKSCEDFVQMLYSSKTTAARLNLATVRAILSPPYQSWSLEI